MPVHAIFSRKVDPVNSHAYVSIIYNICTFPSYFKFLHLINSDDVRFFSLYALGGSRKALFLEEETK